MSKGDKNNEICYPPPAQVQMKRVFLCTNGVDDPQEVGAAIFKDGWSVRFIYDQALKPLFMERHSQNKRNEKN